MGRKKTNVISRIPERHVVADAPFEFEVRSLDDASGLTLSETEPGKGEVFGKLIGSLRVHNSGVEWTPDGQSSIKLTWQQFKTQMNG